MKRMKGRAARLAQYRNISYVKKKNIFYVKKKNIFLINNVKTIIQ